MYGLARGTAMLVGAAIAGFLLWLGAQLEGTNVGGYWALVGLAAGAGLVLALAQLAGGWTKWGAPRVTGGAFLLGFLPALLLGGWLLLASQPEGGFMQGTASTWANDLALGGVFETLSAVLPAIAFAIGLLFGYTFDTTGSRVIAADPAPANDAARPVGDDDLHRDDVHRDDVHRDDVREPAHRDRGVERRAEDEPVAAERDTAHPDDVDRSDEDVEYHEPDRDFVSAISGDRRDRAADDGERTAEGGRSRADEPERGESRRGWFNRG